MKDLEYVLDFAVTLGSRMLTCGANLERVNDTLNRVCRSYGLEDISIHSLSSLIQISARTPDGDYASRQISVPPMDIHLEKLGKLNQLSRTVCAQKPAPSSLWYMLKTSEEVEEYPRWLILLGRLLAMGCMCVLFGGTWQDILVVDIIIFILFFMVDALGQANLNHVIVNIVSMAFASSAAMLFYRLGVGDSYFVIIISCSMLLIPGIPMVNAFRNFLCGNEMNGILELLKAFIETVAIVMGLLVGIALFGGGLLW